MEVDTFCLTTVICRDLVVLASSVRSFAAGELLCRRKNKLSGKRMLQPSYDLFFYVTYGLTKSTVTARAKILRIPGVTGTFKNEQRSRDREEFLYRMFRQI